MVNRQHANIAARERSSQNSPCRLVTLGIAEFSSYYRSISEVRVEVAVADGKIGPLDFALPRIAVLVKLDIDLANPELAELEAFMALSGASNGLFVSWTGFTELAQKEAGRLFHQTKFWDVGRVAEMLRDNYQKLSNDLQSDLRLEKIWVLSR